MRKRANTLLLYLTDEELQDLNHKASLAGLRKTKLIRKLIAEKEINPAPTEDIHKLVWAMYAMVGQARRLVELAEETRVADASDMRELLDRMYRGIELAVNCVARD